MQRRQLLFACLLAIAAAVAAWWLWSRPAEPEPPRGDAATRSADAGTRPGSADASPEDPRRTVARSRDDEDAARRYVRVRLQGLHARAPWTGTLRLELQDRSRARVQHGEHIAEAAVDEDGRCRLELPGWWQPGRMVRIAVDGRQAGYRDASYRERGPLTLADEIVIDLQVVAEVAGVVRNGQGEGVESVRIAAYRLHDGRPVGAAVGETGTDSSGAYRLLATPDVPLLVVAVPMQRQITRYRRLDGVSDTGALNPWLLPAAQETRLEMQKPRESFDFALADAATVEGTLRHPDGRAAADARVYMTAATAASLGAVNIELSEHATLTVLADDTLAVSGDVATDEQGRFALPATPGQQALVQVLSVPFARIVGNLPLQTAVAPARLEITLPHTTTVRAVRDGELLPHARLLTRRGRVMRCEKDGTRQLLVAEPTTLRADNGSLRSPWMELPVRNDDATVDLQLADTLVELAIEIEAEHRVRNARFTWTRTDGQQGQEARQRDDSDGPFSIHLEPGTYQLQIGPGPGERNGLFLMPTTHTVTLGATPKTLTIRALFGGKFACNVLDTDGRRLPGTVVAFGANGTEHRAVMKAGGEPGQLDERGVSTYGGVLQPGPYKLVFDLGARGVHERFVQIVPREVMPVSVRL